MHRDEFSLIRALARPWKTQPPPLGPGDDAAVLPMVDRLVVSTDGAQEGVHFRRTWPISCSDHGFRVLANALSDILAMGARPFSVQIQVIQGTDWTDEDLIAVMEGMADLAQSWSLSLCGGDVIRGPGPTAIVCTVLGTLERGRTPWLRSAAHVGDVLAVTGNTGLAALGLSILEMNHPVTDNLLAKSALRGFTNPALPRQEWKILRELRERVAAIDISDGLHGDLRHLARASTVQARVDIEELPSPPGFDDLAHELGIEPKELLCHGGETCQLAVALAPETFERALEAGASLTPIGFCGPFSSTEPVLFLDAAGIPVELGGTSWMHMHHDEDDPSGAIR